MSITRDLREYADTAIEQGRHVLGQAEKALNLDAIKTAVEPYLAQAKGYGHSVTDRAGSLINTAKNDPRVARAFDTAKKDPRVAKAFDTAEQVTGVVVETVQQRLVQPVITFAGRGATAASDPATGPATDASDEPTEP
jgi:hypothetical protein